MQSQRQHVCPYRGEHRQERMGGIEPHQAGGRDHEFGGHVDDLAAQVWQQAQTVHAMTALSHIRRWTALEVPITKSGELGEQGDAESGFETSSQASEPQSIQQVEEQECY